MGKFYQPGKKFNGNWGGGGHQFDPERPGTSRDGDHRRDSGDYNNHGNGQQSGSSWGYGYQSNNSRGHSNGRGADGRVNKTYPQVAKRLNPQEEQRLREKQKMEKLRQECERKKREMEEIYEYRGVRDRDSDSDDNGGYGSHLIPVETKKPSPPRKRSPSPSRRSPPRRSGRERRRSSTPPRVKRERHSSSSSADDRRKRSHTPPRRRRSPRPQKNRRRRSPTPPDDVEMEEELDPRVLEHPEARESHERFVEPTDKMKIFPNKQKGFRLSSEDEIRAAFKKAQYTNTPHNLIFNALYTYEYHPDHKLFLTDPMNPVVTEMKYIMKDEDYVYFQSSRFLRIFEAELDEENVEEKFREFLLESEDIPISEYKDDFEESWQIKERVEREQKDADTLLKLKIRCQNEEIPEDKQILKALLHIENYSLDPEGYLEYCKAEDQFYERNKQIYSNPDKRKKARLEEGISKCPAAIQLYIELGLLKWEESAQEGIDFFWLKLPLFPHDFRMAQAYLDAIQYNSRLYSFHAMEEAFELVRKWLARTLNGPTKLDRKLYQQLEQHSLDLWIRHLQWLNESGNVERAICSIQVSFESYFKEGHYKTYMQFWDLGAPRVGDLNFTYDRDVKIVNTTKKNDFIGMEFEELQEEMMKEKQLPQLLQASSFLESDTLFSELQRASDEIRSRPLRCRLQVWLEGAPPEIEAHVKKGRRHIEFKQVLVHNLKMERGNRIEKADPFYVLSHFGLKFLSHLPPDYTANARRFGLTPLKDALPLRIQLILLRILGKLVSLPQYSRYAVELPANIVAFCVKAYSGDEVVVRALELLDKLKEGLSEQPEINEAYILLIIKELARLKKIDPEVVSTKLYYSCTTAAQNPESEVWRRIALSYMLIMFDLLPHDEFSTNLPKWLSTFFNTSVYPSDAEHGLRVDTVLAELTFQVTPQIPVQMDPQGIFSLFPSTSSLSLALVISQMHCNSDRAELTVAERLLSLHANCFHNELVGLQAVHLAFLKYLETSVVGHDPTYFFKKLEIHVQQYPNDEEATEMLIRHFKTRAPFIFPQFAQNLNPFYKKFKNIDGSTGKFELFTRLAAFDRSFPCLEKDGQDFVNQYLAEQIKKLAETTNDPYMWRLALKQAAGSFKDIIFECARKKCPWSKALYLDYMSYKQESPIVGSEDILEQMKAVKMSKINTIQNLMTAFKEKI